MTQEDLLKPYLDRAAETLLWVKHKRPLDLTRLKVALRKVLADEGMPSVLVRPADHELITAYFDGHPGFERVSDAPEWVLRVKSFAR
jgi:hypothetical protein